MSQSLNIRIVADVIKGKEAECTQFQLMKQLILKNDEDYKATLARIVATKPHSMDVERIVSSYNLFKSTDHSSLSGQTIQDYLVVRHNMPYVAKFNVRPAVQEWMTRTQRKPQHDRAITKFTHQEYVASVFGTSCSHVDSKPPSVKF